MVRFKPVVAVPLRLLGVVAGVAILYPVWRVFSALVEPPGRRRDLHGFELGANEAIPQDEPPGAEPILAEAIRQSSWARNLLKLFAISLLLPLILVGLGTAALADSQPTEHFHVQIGQDTAFAGDCVVITVTAHEANGSPQDYDDKVRVRADEPDGNSFGLDDESTCQGAGGPSQLFDMVDGIVVVYGVDFDTGPVTITAQQHPSAEGDHASGSDSIEYFPLAVEKVELEPPNDTNVVGTSHIVTATVTDKFGNPTPETPTVVTFTAAGTGFETPNFATVTSDANSQATFTFTSTKTGSSVITATIHGVAETATATANKQWTSGEATTITVQPAFATNVVGTDHFVTATLFDQFGNALSPGAVVTFTATGTGAEDPNFATTTTNGDGQAFFDFTSTQTGVSNITATSGSGVGTAQKRWVEHERITLEPESDSNMVGTNHTVTATVFDKFGTAVSGTVVTFTASGTGAEDPNFATATSDGNGQATFTFTSTLTGNSTITATVATETGFASDTATKRWSEAPATVTLVPASGTNAAGTTHTVTATARDTFGNPVAEGVPVTFTVVGPGSLFIEEVVFTNDDGQAVFGFSSTQTGQSTITASVDTTSTVAVSNAVTKTWVPAGPNQIDLEPNLATNTVNTTHRVTGTVFDEFGNTVTAGHVITFTVTGTSGEFPKTGTDTTDANGQVTFDFSSTKTGTSNITATAAGGATSNTAQKVWQPGPAVAVTLEPKTATNTVGDDHDMVATVRDQFGNPVTTTPTLVTFTVSGTGGEDPTFATVTTTGSGEAEFTFTSTRTGTSRITATIDTAGGSRFDTATKLWLSGEVETITLVPPVATNTIGDTHLLTATFFDEFGNLIDDRVEQVNWEIVSGPGFYTFESTRTSEGVATATHSSTQTGVTQLRVCNDDGPGPFGENGVCDSFPPGPNHEPRAEATKVWEAGPLASVTVDPQSASNRVGETHTVTGTATDEFGNPIAGLPATLTVTGPDAFTFSDTGTTDVNGQVVFSFAAPDEGTSAITITVRDGAITKFGTATKVWVGAPATIDLQPDAATNAINTLHTLTANVQDDDGDPAADGTVVTFTVIGEGAQVGTANTSNGVATFSFTSSQEGNSTITASAQGESGVIVSNQATKLWVIPAAQITLEPPTDTNAAGDTHTVTATVEDQSSNPAPDGTPVTFKVIGAGATEAVRNTTGGQALFSFTSFQAGLSTITASAAGETGPVVSNAVNKLWHHAAPAAIAFSPADPTEFEGNTLTVVATSTDQFGNAISNHDVDFSKSGKPGTVPASDTTDGNGVVTFSVYATTTGIQILTMTVSSDGSDADGAGAGSFSGPNTITWVGKRFTPLPPARILDTRSDNETGAAIGTCTPSPCATIPPNSSIEVEINGHGGVPASAVGAVKLNATVDQPGSSGFLTLYPKGQSQPVVSNLNFTPGDVRANLATVKVGTDGRIIAFNGSLGSLDVIFDVSGWYGDGTQPTEGGSFVSIDPDRLMDTRDGTGGTSGPIPPDGLVTLTVVGVGGVPASGVNAVVLNATIDNPQAPGFLTVYPAGQARPLASNVNFAAGEIVPNLTAVKAGTSGQVVFFNGSPNTVEMVADVFGYFTAPSSTVGGGSIEPLDPSRILDTRAPNEFGASAIGDCTPAPCAAIGAGQTIDVQVAGQGGVPVTAVAVVMNATVDQPTHQGFLTIFPAGQATPLISNLNFVPGDAVPNLVMMKLGAGGKVTIFNGSSGTVHVIFDVNGWFRPILT